MRNFKMFELKLSLGTALIMFLSVSCGELWRTECQVTDKYKSFCLEGFETVKDPEINKVDWLGADSCQYSFKDGCGILISDLEAYNSFIDTSSYNYLEQNSSFWDLESRIIIGFRATTDKGLEAYSKLFLCKNEMTKELRIRCQYEVSNQCTGSRIYELGLSYWISLPKNYSNYELIFEVENANPL